MMKSIATLRVQKISQGQSAETSTKTIQKRTPTQPKWGIMPGANI
jgi:hypothetical protein